MFRILTPCPDCGTSLREKCVDFNQPQVREGYFETHATYRCWCPKCGYARLVHDGNTIEETRDIGEPFEPIHVLNEPVTQARDLTNREDARDHGRRPLQRWELREEEHLPDGRVLLELPNGVGAHPLHRGPRVTPCPMPGVWSGRCSSSASCD